MNSIQTTPVEPTCKIEKCVAASRTTPVAMIVIILLLATRGKWMRGGMWRRERERPLAMCYI